MNNSTTMVSQNEREQFMGEGLRGGMISSGPAVGIGTITSTLDDNITIDNEAVKGHQHQNNMSTIASLAGN